MEENAPLGSDGLCGPQHDRRQSSIQPTSSRSLKDRYPVRCEASAVCLTSLPVTVITEWDFNIRLICEPARCNFHDTIFEDEEIIYISTYDSVIQKLA